ncbi:MAG: hypothetical protein WEB05_08410 [Solirubrobacterales bacterium]
MGFGAYLSGSLATLVGLTALVYVATRLAARLVPGWSGPSRWIAAAVIGVGVAAVLALLAGTFGLLHGWLYLALLGLVALAAWRWSDRIPVSPANAEPGRQSVADISGDDAPGEPSAAVPAFPTSDPPLSDNRNSRLFVAVGLGITSLVVGMFTVVVWQKLGTGMTGFDSTWYHGPFAAGFAASGDTFSLHFLAPQFLSWFYPQNSELFHALGILGFGNDLLSPMLNFGWLAGCLVAAWAIGRPYGAAPVSLAGVALVLGSVAMADQAGEARNDIVGVFFVLAAVAILINGASGARRLATGPLFLVALSAGLAAGTKINFVPAAIALAAGAVYLAGSTHRGRAALLALAGLTVGGAYWYLRNLIQSGNPLPWIDSAGPIALPGPDQELGGRDAASVLSYITDPSVIADWFIPGLADGFGQGWPLLLGLAAFGLLACLWRGSDPARRVAAIAGFALLLAWAFAPTSASGPAGEPAGFVSGLRYLVPALAVGLALLGSAVGPKGPLARGLALATLVLLTPFVVLAGHSRSLVELVAALSFAALTFLVLSGAFWLRRRKGDDHDSGSVANGISTGSGSGADPLPESKPGSRQSGLRISAAVAALMVLLFAGYFTQNRYFDNRYASPEFTTAGLSEAFVWARGIEDESIGTNATRQYPLFGKLLGNEVQYLGVPGSHGGFVKTDSCEQFREAVDRGEYRYLVLTLDRENPDREFPREIAWIEDDPNATEVLRTPPTVIYELDGPLDPATCP